MHLVRYWQQMMLAFQRPDSVIIEGIGLFVCNENVSVDGYNSRRTIPECTTASSIVTVRGVQYVHWVMHKCIMVKVGGNEIHVK